MNDTASLQNLHDIVVPEPVPWWPPAPGWYVLAALATIALLILARKLRQHVRRNRYRGQALRELARIGRSDDKAELRRVPELLKRAALSAWPRESVASLMGPAWHRFLDETAGTNCFESRVGPLLDRLAYARDTAEMLPAADSAAVLDAVRAWLRKHRAPRTAG